MALQADTLNQFIAIVGEANITSDSAQLKNNSGDCYWYSPVLKPQLDDKFADVIIRPGSVEELRAVIALAVRQRIPITMRGAGTGNYGQGIPMQGGILLNTKRLDRILELTPEHARVEAGTLLVTIERSARKIGAEMRFFPSTLLTATAGGFLAGGAGGVGSIMWGTLWDEGNVLSATILTVEEEPRLLTVSGTEALQGVIHSCGLTCVIVDLTFALAPALPWWQAVLAFDSFEDGLRFGEKLAYDDAINKRLITVVEWPVPDFFIQLKKQGACPEGKALALLHVTMSQEELLSHAQSFGGRLTWSSPAENYQRKGLMLSDFSWNHTTLWAIKADERWTYTQDQFKPDRAHEQLRLLKERYGNDFLRHIEFMKFKGVLYPQGLSLLYYRSDEQIAEIIHYSESIDVWVANAHSHRLDDDVRWNGQPILDARHRWDPFDLLNPGHLNA